MTKVNYNTHKNTYKDVQTGDLFVYEGEVYCKTDFLREKELLNMGISTGEWLILAEDDEVNIVEEIEITKYA